MRFLKINGELVNPNMIATASNDEHGLHLVIMGAGAKSYKGADAQDAWEALQPSNPAVPPEWAAPAADTKAAAE